MRYRAAAAFSLGAYVAREFPRARASGDEVVVDCPSCGRPKAYVNVRKSVWFCFRCEARGGAFAFVKAHRRLDDVATARALAEGTRAAPVDAGGAALRRLLAARRRPIAGGAPSGLPAAYRPLPCAASAVGRRAWAYLVDERGVAPEQIAAHRIGFAARGPYAGCVVVPVADAAGAPVYFVARAFARLGGKRYLNPENGTTPRTASEVLFNLDAAALHGRVVLVEGVFDALAEAPVGVAMLGKRLSDAQLALVRAAGVRRAEVRLDDDVPLAASLDVARRLRSVGVADVEVARPIGDPAERRGTLDARAYSLARLVAARVGLPA